MHHSHRPQRSNRTSWLAIAGIFLFAIIMIRLLYMVSFTSDIVVSAKQPKAIRNVGKKSYAIMGDLGSSGSRIYVYTYYRNSKGAACSLGHGGEINTVELMEGFEKLTDARKVNEKKPGVSSLAQSPYDVSAYFQHLLTFAESLVPAEERHKTPIYFLATAGLRGLAEEKGERIFDDDDTDENHNLDPDDDDYHQGDIAKLLNAIRTYVRTHSVFLFSDANVQILRGEEEAMYDWIALQQSLFNGQKLMGKFNNIPIDSQYSQEHGVYTTGIIDTGGMSSQIAYIPHNPSDGNVRINGLFGTNVSLYAKSFMNFGMYESRALLEEQVIRQCLEDPECDTIYNPCFLRGNTQHINYRSQRYDVLGSGDYEQCMREVEKLFPARDECPVHSSLPPLPSPSSSHFSTAPACSPMNGEPLPEATAGTRYIAIDNANRAAQFFGFLGYTKLGNMIPAVKKYCEMPWEQASTWPAGDSEQTNAFRLKRYCYEGVYVIALMNMGYRFPLASPSAVVGFADYIGGNHLNWALGATSYHLHRMCNAGELV